VVLFKASNAVRLSRVARALLDDDPTTRTPTTGPAAAEESSP
jgi:hypothetical protein